MANAWQQSQRLQSEVVSGLERGLPGQGRTSIVHGDFRGDDTLVAGSDSAAHVPAVVDWELSTIGDPVADVAMMCAYREPAFDTAGDSVPQFLEIAHQIAIRTRAGRRAENP